MGPGDVLSINVSGLREFESSTRVSNSGRIRVPYVGIMFVAGSTAVELEREIARLIKEHELVNEPTVRVQVQEQRSRPTYVIGEVNAPGQFVITREMYLLDVLSKAGGLLATAADVGFLYRRNWPRPSTGARMIGAADAVTDGQAESTTAPPPVSPDPSQDSKPEEVMPIDFYALGKGTRPELNLRLQGGDILYVPRRRADQFYVIGDVIGPGAFTMPRRGKVTAAQAIVYAGGTLRTAKSGKGFLMRHDQAGVRQTMPVDFAAIIQGRAPDFPIQPNDIIFIPNSAGKTIGLALLDMVPELVRQWVIF